MIIRALFTCFILLFSSIVYAQDSLLRLQIEEILNLKVETSMEDVLNTEVVSASNSAEKLSEAPASIIVLTKKQLDDRGYLNLVEVLRDLPEMDVAMMYGGSVYKNYFRGYRINFGSPFLLMVDGVIFNNLYYNETPTLAAIPISSVNRIEVVYGPASVVYGPNAFMGVINVITNKTNQDKNLKLLGTVSSSFNGYTWADMNVAYQKNKIRFSLSARLENGNVNQFVDNNSFYWLRDEHYANTKLWGDLANTAQYGGKFSSYINNYGIDARLQIDKLEIAFSRYRTAGGYGLVYAADKVLPNTDWILPETSIYARYQGKVGANFFSKTLLRYRESGADPTANDIEGFNITNNGTSPQKIGGNTFIDPKESIRVLQFTYWPIRNSSWSLYQDFEWQKSKNFSFFAGFKYEIKDLQKAFETYSSDYYFPDSLKVVNNFYPAMPPQFFTPAQNRLQWQDRGIYAQIKWKINEENIFTAGYRIDNNSSYGTSPTLRLGYTRKMGSFLLKAFYGEAFQEPAPRLLYSNWRGSGADPSLRPETSRTTEMTVNYTNKKISTDFNVYYVLSANAINTFPSGAKNIGGRSITGLSWRIQGSLPFFKQSEWWVNYSWIIAEGEDKYDSKGNFTKTDIIGDLAHHKIQGGITAEIFKNLNICLIFRYLSDRDNVLSNPIRKTPASFVMDSNVTYKNLFVKGLNLRLKVDNVFDTQYFMAGINSAASGDQAGTWNGRAWTGSGSFFNSLMPQPRRFASVSLSMEF